MKLFTFYVEHFRWGDEFHYPIIIRRVTVDGFMWESDNEKKWEFRKNITTTKNLEKNWPDDEIISSIDEVPDKHQLIETIFTGIKE